MGLMSALVTVTVTAMQLTSLVFMKRARLPRLPGFWLGVGKGFAFLIAFLYAVRKNSKFGSGGSSARNGENMRSCNHLVFIRTAPPMFVFILTAGGIFCTGLLLCVIVKP